MNEDENENHNKLGQNLLFCRLPVLKTFQTVVLQYLARRSMMSDMSSAIAVLSKNTALENNGMWFMQIRAKSSPLVFCA